MFLKLKNRQFTHDSRITPNKTAKAGIYPLNAPEITPKTTPKTTHPIPPPPPKKPSPGGKVARSAG